jgi:hypothetical protein
LDRSPPTLVSHAVTGPTRTRSAWFFVVLIVLLLGAIAVGALVVIFVLVPMRSAASTALPIAPAMSTPAAVTSTAHDAGSIADSSPAPSVTPRATVQPTTTARTSATVAAGAQAGPCMCRARNPENSSGDVLCDPARVGVAWCYCKVDNATICPTPFTEGCPTAKKFGGTATAKEGDPCDGWVNDNERRHGKMETCELCPTNETYGGKIGSACVGVRSDRVQLTGVVDCMNLEYRCTHGDARGCEELKLHR